MPSDPSWQSLSPDQRQKVEAQLRSRGIDPATATNIHIEPTDATDAAESPEPSPGYDKQQVTTLIREDKLIPAIKLIREQTGLGLAEAKAIADGLCAEMGMKPKAGCAGMIVLVVGAGTLLAML